MPAGTDYWAFWSSDTCKAPVWTEALSSRRAIGGSRKGAFNIPDEPMFKVISTTRRYAMCVYDVAFGICCENYRARRHQLHAGSSGTRPRARHGPVGCPTDLASDVKTSAPCPLQRTIEHVPSPSPARPPLRFYTPAPDRHGVFVATRQLTSRPSGRQNNGGVGRLLDPKRREGESN